jgi:hypothetical protein
MKSRFVVAGVLAGGLTLLVPVLAYGQSSAPASSSPEAPPTSSSSPPAPRMFLGLSPQSGAPGDQVLVSVGCTPPSRIHGVSSPVLDIGALKPVSDPGNAPRSEAVATVKKSAAPGRYPVTAGCGGSTLHAEFTVTGTRTTRPPGTAPSTPSEVSKVPSGPAQTGGGGTAG